MKSRHNRFPTVSAVLLALACAVPPAASQDAKPTVDLRYAAAAPLRSVWGMQLERINKSIEEQSQGTIKLNLFMGGQLGGDAEIVQQVARGRLDAGGVGIAFASLLVPELQLLVLPMYFRSPAEVDCAIDRHLGGTIAQRLATKGVRVIGWGEAGTLDLVGKRPFTSPRDVAGVKAGTYGARMGTIMWQSLGANPTSTTSLELASAFQTGLIDVVSVVPAFYVPAGVNKVAPVLTRLDLHYVPVVSIMNKAVWDKLTPDQRDAFTRGFENAPLTQVRQEVRAFQQQMLDAHVKGGGQIVEATPQQREAFRKAISDAWPRMAQEAGPEGPKFFALMEAARKACEAGS